MRLPIRKAEKDRNQMAKSKPAYLTKAGINKINNQIKNLKQNLPEMRAELTRTKEMGDLSENAAYQEAKFALRRANNKLLVLEERLKQAIEIKKPTSSKTATIGSTITIEDKEGHHITYKITGSLEADPTKHTISNESPLGTALLNKSKNQKIKINLPSGEKTYKIIKIN